uniref:Cyclin-dependent kinase inhibitor 1B n=1 Tax=Sphenodon punctatus TaxID=8508 RepID=A0A8D0HH50_SPHPU
MSNVRISNGSPTLERMEGRQADYPKPSACRNLFGPVNHEELNRDLQKHRRDMEEAYQRKWNFDFQNHKPLEGRFEWQAVDKGSLPDFYIRPPQLPKAPAACKSASHQHLDVNGNCQALSLVTAQGISEDASCAERKTDAASESQTDLAEQCAAQRKRPATDDSSPQNKRANTTEEEVSEDSPSASSVEQTPKKSSPKRRQT